MKYGKSRKGISSKRFALAEKRRKRHTKRRDIKSTEYRKVRHKRGIAIHLTPAEEREEQRKREEEVAKKAKISASFASKVKKLTYRKHQKKVA